MKIIFEPWDGRVYARFEDGSLHADGETEEECRNIMMRVAEARHADAIAAHDEAMRDLNEAKEGVTFWEERVGLLNGDG